MKFSTEAKLRLVYASMTDKINAGFFFDEKDKKIDTRAKNSMFNTLKIGFKDELDKMGLDTEVRM